VKWTTRHDRVKVPKGGHFEGDLPIEDTVTVVEAEAVLFRWNCGRAFPGGSCDKSCDPKKCKAHPLNFKTE
jgi:hypothetical protein